MKFIDKLGDYIFSEEFESWFCYLVLIWVAILVVIQIHIKFFGPLG